MALVSQSFCKVNNAIYQLCRHAAEPRYARVKKRIMNLVGHALNGSRPFQDIFTADTIASSRVESLNSAIKSAGANHKITILDCLDIIKRFIRKQESFVLVKDRCCWPYVLDHRFQDCIEGYPIPVSNEVLDCMYREFCLSISVKYVVFQNSDGTYNVRCNDDEDKVYDTHRVVHEGEGAFSCRCTTDDPRILFGYCNIRMGHPCRHIFAVAAFSGLKISMRSINTRFYLDQSSVDFDSVNEKAKTTMIKAIEDKKIYWGDTFIEKPCADVSTNIEKGVDVDKAFNEKADRLGPPLKAFPKSAVSPRASTSPGLDKIEILEETKIREANGVPLEANHSGVKIIRSPRMALSLWNKEGVERRIKEEIEKVSELSEEEMVKMYRNYVREYANIIDINVICRHLNDYIRAVFTHIASYMTEASQQEVVPDEGNDEDIVMINAIRPERDISNLFDDAKAEKSEGNAPRSVVKKMKKITSDDSITLPRQRGTKACCERSKSVFSVKSSGCPAIKI